MGRGAASARQLTAGARRGRLKWRPRRARPMRDRCYTARMRIVGSLNRSAFEPDPHEAWRRARVLDTWLRAARPPHARGAIRATHDAMMRLDEARMVEAARTVNRR